MKPWMPSLVFICWSLLGLGLYGCAAAFQQRGESYERGPKEIDPMYSTQKDSVPYRLSVLPQWANFSSSGRCFRETFVEYLDYDLLAKNYRMNYAQAVSMQKVWNYKRYGQHEKEKQKTFTMDRRGRFYGHEDQLFFEALEQVLAGRVPMKKLKAPGVNMIWVDPLWKKGLFSEKAALELASFFRNFLEQGDFLRYPYVFFSVCLSHSELTRWLEANLGMKEESYWGVITTEMFSIYDDQGIKWPKMSLNLKAFFEGAKDIIFYNPEMIGQEAWPVPGEVEGITEVRKYRPKFTE